MQGSFQPSFLGNLRPRSLGDTDADPHPAGESAIIAIPALEAVSHQVEEFTGHHSSSGLLILCSARVEADRPWQVHLTYRSQKHLPFRRPEALSVVSIDHSHKDLRIPRYFKELSCFTSAFLALVTVEPSLTLQARAGLLHPRWWTGEASDVGCSGFLG